MHDEVNRGNQEHDYNHGDPQTTDNGPCQRRILLASGLNAQRHGKQTEKCGERGHENRPQADLARLHDSFLQLHTTFMQDAGKFHDQNTVGYHDAGHHDHAHQGHDVQRRLREQQNQDDST